MIEVWQKLFPVVSFLELMEGHHIWLIALEHGMLSTLLYTLVGHVGLDRLTTTVSAGKGRWEEGCHTRMVRQFWDSTSSTLVPPDILVGVTVLQTLLPFSEDTVLTSWDLFGCLAPEWLLVDSALEKSLVQLAVQFEVFVLRLCRCEWSLHLCLAILLYGHEHLWVLAKVIDGVIGIVLDSKCLLAWGLRCLKVIFRASDCVELASGLVPHEVWLTRYLEHCTFGGGGSDTSHILLYCSWFVFQWGQGSWFVLQLNEISPKVWLWLD